MLDCGKFVRSITTFSPFLRICVHAFSGRVRQLSQNVSLQKAISLQYVDGNAHFGRLQTAVMFTPIDGCFLGSWQRQNSQPTASLHLQSSEWPHTSVQSRTFATQVVRVSASELRCPAGSVTNRPAHSTLMRVLLLQNHMQRSKVI